jgi:hypothetical protein
VWSSTVSPCKFRLVYDLFLLQDSQFITTVFHHLALYNIYSQKKYFEVDYLTTLPVSKLYIIENMMINEYGAVHGYKLVRETDVLEENPPQSTLSTTNHI